MAAKQAKELTKDKEIFVIPTKNVMQGINCLAYFTESNDIDEITNQFNETIAKMKTLQTTYSIRDTVIDGIEIKENDYISLGDNGLLSTNADIVKSIFEAYEKIQSDNDSAVTIFYGEDVKESDADNIKEEFERRYPKLAVQVIKGNQPVYYYYISVE
jgi:dihydroxyacetone kinase-like predicted kinase